MQRASAEARSCGATKRRLLLFRCPDLQLRSIHLFLCLRHFVRGRRLLGLQPVETVVFFLRLSEAPVSSRSRSPAIALKSDARPPFSITSNSARELG